MRSGRSSPDDGEAAPASLFNEVVEARRFHRRLLLWLDASAPAEQGAMPGQFVLSHLLSLHEPGYGHDVAVCRSCNKPYPCETIIGATATSQMPIEWSGSALAAHLAQVHADYTWDADVQALSRAGDPARGFRRCEDARWDGWRSERGNTDLAWPELSDEEMVAEVLHWHRQRGYPYMWQVESDDVDWIRARLSTGRRRWADTKVGASHAERRQRWRQIPVVDPLSAVGWSRLGLAVLDDDVTAARHAIEAGEDPERRDGEGRRPLHLAAEYTALAVATYLLDEVGVEIDAVIEARGNTTALFQAVFAGAHDRHGDALITLLVEHGASPDTRRSPGGESPRELAVRLFHSGYYRNVEPLLGPSGDS